MPEHNRIQNPHHHSSGGASVTHSHFKSGQEGEYETVRLWWTRFGPMFASEIRKQRASCMRGFRQWRWHLDEMYVKIGGEMYYLWRAVDHEGEVLESYATKTHDKPAALRFMKKAMKRYGKPEAIVTEMKTEETGPGPRRPASEYTITSRPTDSGAAIVNSRRLLRVIGASDIMGK